MSGILGNALTGGIPGAVSAVAQFAGKILDRAIPDPVARAAAELELARLDQTGELAQLAADTDMFKAALADTASARAQTVALAQTGSRIAWGAPVVSVLVVGMFGAILALISTHAVPAEARDLLNVMLGSLAASFGAVVQYWVGSSAGSQSKDATIQAAVTGR